MNGVPFVLPPATCPAPHFLVGALALGGGGHRKGLPAGNGGLMWVPRPLAACWAAVTMGWGLS